MGNTGQTAWCQGSGGGCGGVTTRHELYRSYAVLSFFEGLLAALFFASAAANLVASEVVFFPFPASFFFRASSAACFVASSRPFSAPSSPSAFSCAFSFSAFFSFVAAPAFCSVESTFSVPLLCCCASLSFFLCLLAAAADCGALSASGVPPNSARISSKSFSLACFSFFLSFFDLGGGATVPKSSEDALGNSVFATSTETGGFPSLGAPASSFASASSSESDSESETGR
mmetsp:Transcript_116572/g.249273  ORF Transcript_116572/g.249273 Transcript_116572/m.249273 type:complete len:230 (+) Transcript_116572:181-870(+)